MAFMVGILIRRFRRRAHPIKLRKYPAEVLAIGSHIRPVGKKVSVVVSLFIRLLRVRE